VAPLVLRIRELEVRYRPNRLALAVSGPVSHPKEAACLAHVILADAHVEKFIALHFNAKRSLIGYQVVSVGTLDATIVHPREVFKAAVLANACSLIVAHNHPSGDPTPSPEDRTITSRLAESGRLLGIELDDSLVVADGDSGLRYFSFREQGVL
jgi:DNA repair protein RadC